jgi:hypothetical protein
MLISELLKENEHPKHKSALPKAASINDEPEELELDDELDDEDESEDDKQAAIDAFKAAGKDLGEGLYAVTIFPDAWPGSTASEVNAKEDAINGLLKAFPEFHDKLPKEIPSEDLFVTIFNEASESCGFAIASDEDYKLKKTGFIKSTTSPDGRMYSEKQGMSIGTIYSTMRAWAEHATKENRSKVISLLK